MKLFHFSKRQLLQQKLINLPANKSFFSCLGGRNKYSIFNNQTSTSLNFIQKFKKFNFSSNAEVNDQNSEKEEITKIFIENPTLKNGDENLPIHQEVEKGKINNN
jgi:hypothetical protein